MGQRVRRTDCIANRVTSVLVAGEWFQATWHFFYVKKTLAFGAISGWTTHFPYLNYRYLNSNYTPAINKWIMPPSLYLIFYRCRILRILIFLCFFLYLDNYIFWISPLLHWSGIDRISSKGIKCIDNIEQNIHVPDNVNWYNFLDILDEILIQHALIAFPSSHYQHTCFVRTGLKPVKICC